ATAEPQHAKLSMTELMKLRASVAERVEEAEAKWVQASEGLEVAA
ncbi:MAG: transporter ATP-binding protein, partial [Sphingomonadales bacterium]|nr:transporter ATP-binding protein [Sphingomonadales bacterium]